MSSGYFPVDRNDKGDPVTSKLIQAEDLLEDAITEAMQQARELGCAEDGMADGAYIGELRVALLLVGRCFKGT